MRGRKLIDYSNSIHGCWKVIERDLHPTSKSHETFWISKCQNCGKIASVRKTDLDKNPKSCNNCKGDFSNIAKTKKYDIKPGDIFGYLTALNRPHSAQMLGINKNSKEPVVKCQCKCGNIVYVRKSHLLGLYRRSRTISCGCATMSSGELKIQQILEDTHTPYIYNYVIPEFSSSSPFDFAILDDKNNVIRLIEFDGQQHYEVVKAFGGEEAFKKQQTYDENKNKYCKEHNIDLKRIPYWDFNKLTLDYLLS